QLVDILLVLAGAERRNDDRLRLTAGEECRAVRARQDADFRDDRTNRRKITAVDARAGVEDVPADDLRLQFLEYGGDLLRRPLRFLAFSRGEVCLHLGLHGVDGSVALLLDGE